MAMKDRARATDKIPDYVLESESPGKTLSRRHPKIKDKFEARARELESVGVAPKFLCMHALNEHSQAALTHPPAIIFHACSLSAYNRLSVRSLSTIQCSEICATMHATPTLIDVAHARRDCPTCLTSTPRLCAPHDLDVNECCSMCRSSVRLWLHCASMGSLMLDCQ